MGAQKTQEHVSAALSMMESVTLTVQVYMRSHHLSSRQRQQPPAQMKTLHLGNPFPTSSPCLYREQKPPEEMATA